MIFHNTVEAQPKAKDLENMAKELPEKNRMWKIKSRNSSQVNVNDNLKKMLRKRFLKTLPILILQFIYN